MAKAKEVSSFRTDSNEKSGNNCSFASYLCEDVYMPMKNPWHFTSTNSINKSSGKGII